MSIVLLVAASSTGLNNSEGPREFLFLSFKASGYKTFSLVLSGYLVFSLFRPVRPLGMIMSRVSAIPFLSNRKTEKQSELG